MDNKLWMCSWLHLGPLEISPTTALVFTDVTYQIANFLDFLHLKELQDDTGVSEKRNALPSE
jgi:hypothetical protein